MLFCLFAVLRKYYNSNEIWGEILPFKGNIPDFSLVKFNLCKNLHFFTEESVYQIFPLYNIMYWRPVKY